ncbi:hypothetical protein V7056_13610 [Bacillus sp. JJ664]
MTEFFYTLCAIIVLLILLFLINLNLTKTGKLIVIAMSFLFCELGIYLTNLFNLIGTIAILFVLMLATTYLFQSKLNGIIFIRKSQNMKHFHEDIQSHYKKQDVTKNLQNGTATGASSNELDQEKEIYEIEHSL